MKKKHLLSLTLLLALSTSFANVRLPRLFCDHMILQQQTKNTVWGWADPGEKVTIKASWGASAETKADATGAWKAFLNTPSYGTGHTLSINGTTINNVAIGEVWLCAGQSNMAMMVR